MITALSKAAESGELTGERLVSGSEAPVFEKYDDYIPPSLLRHAYATDKLDVAEAIQRVTEIQSEF